MKRKRFLIVLLSIHGALGCGEGPDTPADRGARIDTVGGVVHVVNDGSGVWRADDRWTVDTSRAVVIGVVDGEEPYVFGGVAGVVVGGDGRIYVADAQAMEVRVFSPTGEFLTRFGRDGEGPGEFRNISGLGLVPDGGIATVDGGLGRASVFTADGDFVRSIRLERPYRMYTYGALVRFDDEGRFHDLTQLSRGIGVDTLAVVRYAVSGEIEDTTIVAIHEPQDVVVRRNGVPVMSFTVPFAPRPSSTVGPDGVVYATRGDAYEIAQLAPSGDTLRVIRRTIQPAPVTAAERNAALRHVNERYREAAGAEPRDLPPIPDRRPAIASLLVDEAGHLWALRPTGGAQDSMEWNVFGADGRFLGAVSMPGMTVLHIGEHSIAGVTQDELGVARVVVLPLDRGGAGVQ